MKIILASKSPRRSELLSLMGIKNFEIMPAVGPERVGTGLSPSDTVEHLARGKAEEIREKAGPEPLIIAADTLVFLDGTPLGKPAGEEEAKRMLRSLSGRSHEVFTGVCVSRGETVLAESERSAVWFRPLTEEEIGGYVSTGEPMDKAGAYGAQGLGAMLVSRIDGDFFNVMGLPVCRLYGMLKQFDIDLLKGTK